MRPKDISSKLPKLISLIRIIWVNSPHYNTRERLTSLFRKVRVCGAGAKGSSDLLKDGEAFRGTYVLKGTEEWPGGGGQAGLPGFSACFFIPPACSVLRVGAWARQLASR